MDLFINSNHCGGIASSYTSSTSRGILLSADTGAKFLSLGQTDIDGNSGASWYTLNFGLNPSGWTERHIFLGSSNFPVQPKNGKGYVVVSNVTGGGFRNIRQIYHGHPDSSTDYLQYEDVTGADYYCKTSWVSDIKLKANITKINRLYSTKSPRNRSAACREFGWYTSDKSGSCHTVYL